jgi:sialidase-1
MGDTRIFLTNVNMLRVYFFVALILISGVGCSKESNQAPSEITIISTATINPVLKGLSTNPLLHIAVYIPEGNAETNYRSIQCTLNKDALSDLEKIEVFVTTSEAFNTNTRVATLLPTVENFDIPIDLKAKPGVHHLWVSGMLKNSANIDHFIELHGNSMTDFSGIKKMISEYKSGFKKRMGVALRKAGDDGVNTYRIPGIVTTDKGTLIAVYDVRYTTSRDLPGNIDVGANRSTDGGKTWEKMKIIMDMGAPHENNGVGDPCILFDPVTKKIWVAALWSKGNRSIAGSGPGLTPDETGQFVVSSSSDDGLTWSEPFSITPQVKDPKWKIFFQGPGNGTVMKDGTLVFPAQYWDENGVPHGTIVYSADHGTSWKSGKSAKSNTTESQVVETTPGTLMLNMRDNRGSFRSVATTTDFGKNWTEHATSYNALQDPVCMGSLIKEPVEVKGVKKEVLFFSNPNTSSGRNNITIKASLDLGETWDPINQLLVDERECYGYSSLTKIDDQTIGILYEGTKDLYFVRIPIADIIK